MNRPARDKQSEIPALRLDLVVLCVVAAFNAAAQSNSIPPYAQWFSAPAPQLQNLGGEQQPSALEPKISPRDSTSKSSPAQANPGNYVSPAAGSFTLNTRGDDRQFQQFILQHPDYGFVPITHPPEDGVTKTFNAIFKPEEIHIGRKATFSCTILTAVKRKNPLCLLNPIFLHVSW